MTMRVGGWLDNHGPPLGLLVKLCLQINTVFVADVRSKESTNDIACKVLRDSFILRERRKPTEPNERVQKGGKNGESFSLQVHGTLFFPSPYMHTHKHLTECLESWYMHATCKNSNHCDCAVGMARERSL